MGTNNYAGGFRDGLTEYDRARIASHFGTNLPQDVGPPLPPKSEDMKAANAGDVNALARLLNGVAKNPDGSLQDPDPKSHHQRSADPAVGTVSKDFAWQGVKEKLGTVKTLSGKVPKKKLPKTPPKDVGQAMIQLAEANAPESDDEALKDLKGLIDKYEKSDRGTDWSPVISLVDSWTGSNLLGAYDKPLSEEEREKIVLTLRGKLAEQQGDLDIRRDTLVARRQEAKDRMEFQSDEKKKDRELREQIARIGASASAARSESAEENRHITRRSKYLKENKNALSAIARARYGVKDDSDKSYELHLGSLNQDIYDTGLELEQMGAAEKGQGYQMALEFYLNKPSGPDGADR